MNGCEHCTKVERGAASSSQRSTSSAAKGRWRSVVKVVYALIRLTFYTPLPLYIFGASVNGCENCTKFEREANSSGASKSSAAKDRRHRASVSFVFVSQVCIFLSNISAYHSQKVGGVVWLKQYISRALSFSVCCLRVMCVFACSLACVLLLCPHLSLVLGFYSLLNRKRLMSV